VFKIAFDKNDNFYPLCKRIALIFELIKRVINLLESRTATLADCFIGIVQIAIALKKIPISNDLYTLAIAVFNARYEQFDISPYLLTYFLYPNYRNNGLKRMFCNICKLAVSYYKDMHHSKKEYYELVSQLINYKAKVMLWDIEFSSNLMLATWWGVVEDEYNHLQELTKTMFAIVPSQASCEQNFSILKWFSEGRHTWLQVSRLESMAQIYSFYVSNFKKKLKFYDNNCVETELYNSVLNEMIFAEMDNVELNNENKDELEIVNLTANDITMALQDLVDLSDPVFGTNNNQEEITLFRKNYQRIEIIIFIECNFKYFFV
ncbi:5034_t:CDS:1, partial [Cetraspora pellucida]